MPETSTKPYLLRALYEWCTDNGFTPYVAVRVDAHTRVPREFVKDGEIVLNISFDATSGLQMGNDWVEFSARFGGVAQKIEIPVRNILAIYARENGQGMAFPVEKDTADSAPPALSDAAQAPAAVSDATSSPSAADAGDDADNPPRTPNGNGRNHLKIVK